MGCEALNGCAVIAQEPGVGIPAEVFARAGQNVEDVYSVEFRDGGARLDARIVLCAPCHAGKIARERVKWER
jgi:hypothetical protein